MPTPNTYCLHWGAQLGSHGVYAHTKVPVERASRGWSPVSVASEPGVLVRGCLCSEKWPYFFFAQVCYTLCPQGWVCPWRVPFSRSHRGHVAWVVINWGSGMRRWGRNLHPGKTFSVFCPRHLLNPHLIPSKCIRFFIIYLPTLSSPYTASGRPEYRSQIQIPRSLLSSSSFAKFPVETVLFPCLNAAGCWWCWWWGGGGGWFFCLYFSFMFLASEAE